MKNRDSVGRFTKKTGRICHKGYLAVYMPKHPHAKANGYVLEHILAAEKMLGRPLMAEEVVHHIDGNKHNNKADNLMVFPNQSAHAFYHWNELKKPQTIAEMARNAGKPYSVVYQRIKKLGWSVEDALAK